MDSIEQHKQIKFFSAFTQADREKRLDFIRTSGTMASKTCKEHFASVATTFVFTRRQDPRFDLDRQLSRVLLKQAKGSDKRDNDKMQQQAIPIKIIKGFCTQQTTYNVQ